MVKFTIIRTLYCSSQQQVCSQTSSDCEVIIHLYKEFGEECSKNARWYLLICSA